MPLLDNNSPPILGCLKIHTTTIPIPIALIHVYALHMWDFLTEAPTGQIQVTTFPHFLYIV